LGQTRTWKLTWEYFNKHALQALNCDLALCVSTVNEYEIDNPFFKHAKYMWNFAEPSNWESQFEFLYDEMCSNGQITCDRNNTNKYPWKLLYEVKDQWLGPLGNQLGSAGILIYFRQF